LCQTRCHSINVKTKHLLASSAIVVEAGPGKEDRMSSGSGAQTERLSTPGGGFLPAEFPQGRPAL